MRMAERWRKVTIRPLAVPVLANVTAKKRTIPKLPPASGRTGHRPGALARKHAGACKGLDVDTTVELGGNKVLTGMVKRIDKDLADDHARYARRHRSFRERLYECSISPAKPHW